MQTYLIFCVFLAAMICYCLADWNVVPLEKHDAAVDGFQSKIGNDVKEGKESEIASLRNVNSGLKDSTNAFIKFRKRSVKSFLDSSEVPGMTSSTSGKESDLEVKRNVATLARLGRLNAIRYGQSRLAAMKKTNKDEHSLRQNKYDVRTEKEMDPSDDSMDCYQNGISSDVEVEQNFKNKKRYVAALARSGRLPIWHSINKWDSAKRDPAFDRSRILESEFNDVIDRVSDKYKRCKKLLSYQTLNPNLASLVGFNSGEHKKNLAAMARNGKLFLNSNSRDKRRMKELESNEGSIERTEKRNIAALARNGKLTFKTPQANKRNIQAMARNGKLLFNSLLDHKRSTEESESEEDVFETHSDAEKRNIAALARNGKIPFKNTRSNKRNIQAMARNGKLLFNSFLDHKRSTDESEEDENANKNKLKEQKRNVAALARNGKLPIRNSQDDKRNIQGLARKGNTRFNNFQTFKRNVQAMAKNGKLLFNSGLNHKKSAEESESSEDETEYKLNMQKRKLAALTQNGKLPFQNSQEGKRNIQSMARNGNLHFNNLQTYKRNIQAMARNGKIYFHSYLDPKRSKEESEREDTLKNQSDMYKMNLGARGNGKLPAKNHPDDKRNIQALARNGKLFNNHYSDKKRFKEESESDDLETESEIQKRNLAALARNGKLPFRNQNDKRNVQAMARNRNLKNYKRNIQAMARKGNLLFNSYPDHKRSMEELESDEDAVAKESDIQQNNLAALALNGELQFRSSQANKRNVQAIARNGKLRFSPLPNYKKRKEDLTETDMEDNLSEEQLANHNSERQLSA